MRHFTVANKLVYIAIFCAILCFQWSIQDKILVHIEPRELLELKQEAEVCSKITGISSDYLRKITESTSDDRASKHFFQCVIHNTGYIEDDGHFIVDRMLVLPVVNGTKEDYENNVRECSKITKEDAIETAVANGECIRQNYVFRPAPQGPKQ